MFHPYGMSYCPLALDIVRGCICGCFPCACLALAYMLDYFHHVVDGHVTEFQLDGFSYGMVPNMAEHGISLFFHFTTSYSAIVAFSLYQFRINELPPFS